MASISAHTKNAYSVNFYFRLKKSDDQLDYSISSVKNLVEARGVKFSDVVRGDISLGTLIQTQGELIA